MNAKARRAELSRMIDGTNYSYRYKTQLAIAATTGKLYDCVILSKTDSSFLPQKFKNNGKMNILKAILRYELSHFSAPIKVTSKQCDCVILSKSSGTCIANINPYHWAAEK